MAVRWLYLARHAAADPAGALSAEGREQARLLGERLAGVSLEAIHHGPLPRAAETARIVADRCPGVPVRVSELVDDYVPPVPDRCLLPAAAAANLAGVTPREFDEGARLAARALERFACPAGRETRELLVTHSFQVGWFARHALDTPPWRWISLHAANAALTVIRYADDRPPTLAVFNDLSHLPPRLHWTGFPDDRRP